MITNECSRSTRSVHARDDESARVAPVDSGAVGIAAFAVFGGPLFGFETGVASRAAALRERRPRHATKEIKAESDERNK